MFQASFQIVQEHLGLAGTLSDALLVEHALDRLLYRC